MRHHIFLKSAFAFVLLIALAFVSRNAAPQTTPNPVSLRLLASESGNYVSYAQPSLFPRYDDVDQLTVASTQIIAATAGDNVCQLSADESSVTTNFEFTVRNVFKGTLQVGSVITVTVLGGRVMFKQPDGRLTTAEIRVPWFKKPVYGMQYYLF